MIHKVKKKKRKAKKKYRKYDGFVSLPPTKFLRTPSPRPFHACEVANSTIFITTFLQTNKIPNKNSTIRVHIFSLRFLLLQPFRFNCSAISVNAYFDT